MRKKFLVTALALLFTFSTSAVGLAAKPDHAGKGKPDKEQPAPTAKAVCVDPGHGGSDPGTSNGGIVEKDLNLDVAFSLKSVLETDGFQVYMTRTDDSTKSNNDRYTFCNGTDAAMLISVHHNGSTDSGIDYTLGLYHQRKSKKLAEMVGSEVAAEFGQSDTFRTDRFPSGVLIKSEMPSMMSEGYFLTNDQRRTQLDDYSVMVDREAQALARGANAYFESL